MIDSTNDEVWVLDYVAPYGTQILRKYGESSWHPQKQRAQQTYEQHMDSIEQAKQYFTQHKGVINYGKQTEVHW